MSDPNDSPKRKRRGRQRRRRDGPKQALSADEKAKRARQARDATEAHAHARGDDTLRDDEGSTEEGSTEEGSTEEGSTEEGSTEEGSTEEGSGKWRLGRHFWLAILLVAIVELWLFGRRGDIRVCVGREGEHELELAGQPRTEDNTRRYPTCETRRNIGLQSRYDDVVEDAMLHACRRATVLRGRHVTLQCALEDGGWSHEVRARWIAPWDERYLDRMFWFL